MQRRYITVDVFTDRAFGGNPLTVVLDSGWRVRGERAAMLFLVIVRSEATKQSRLALRFWIASRRSQ